MKSQFYSQFQQLILVYIFFCFYSLFLLKHHKALRNLQNRLEGENKQILKISKKYRYCRYICKKSNQYYRYEILLIPYITTYQ